MNKKVQKFKQLRLPKDFIWKVMDNLSICLSSERFIESELKIFNQIVRKRDIEMYLDTCKTRWALNKLEEHLVQVRRPDWTEKETIRYIRSIRLLTMFEKFQFPSKKDERINSAYGAFMKYEKLCKSTNLDPIFHTYKYDIDDQEMNTIDAIYTVRVMRHMEEFIRIVLGSELNFRIMYNSLRHGPGATVDRRGSKSTLLSKMIPPYGANSGASQHFINSVESDDIFSRALRDLWIKNLGFQQSDGYLHPNFLLKKEEESCITFVPKDAKKDRTINIEPTANVYLQLGVDGIIRRNLKSFFRIDINTQEKNQRLAKIGSETDKLVSLDISGASDCVALTLLNLFPLKWQQFLTELRMTKGTFSHTGESVIFEKLSTMGNGFTFAIETLIFSAILYGVAKEKNLNWFKIIDTISVYGDDIIIPTELYSDYSFMLHRLGFRENVQKTFSRGLIRESCGHDFYHGHRIDRPTFKSLPSLYPELYVLHNSFYKLEIDYGFCFTCLKTFILKYIPVKEYGPYDPEDMICWIFAPKEQYITKLFYHKDYQRFYFRLRRCQIVHPSIFKQKKNKDFSLFDHVEKISFGHFLPLVFYKRQLYRSSESPRDFRLTPNGGELSSQDILKGIFYLKKIRTVRVAITLVPFLV